MEEKTSFLGPLAASRALKDRRGYLFCAETGKPLHRLIYYAAHPKVNRKWHIHHINGDKKDNDILNLIAIPCEVHVRLHKNWPMWGLPAREELVKWWKSGALIHSKGDRVARLAKRPHGYKRNRKRQYSRPAVPFEPKVIVRKAGVKEEKPAVVPRRPAGFRQPGCFRTPKTKKRKVQNPPKHAEMDPEMKERFEYCLRKE